MLRALFEFLEQSLTYGCEPAGCLSSPEGYYVIGYDDFRPGQEKAATALLRI